MSFIRVKKVFTHIPDLDTIGRGRLPWMIKPTSIIVFTDGGKLTSQGNIKNELVIPGSTLPAFPLKPYLEPFRWDQRVFSMTLKLNGNDEAEGKPASAATDHLAPLCDVTGGRNHTGERRTLENISLLLQLIEVDRNVS